MRKDKDKQCKKHETTIGKIIYGFLLFLPLLAISVTCGYAMFNKNAYQSYDNYVNEITTNVPLTSNLVNGQTYTINPVQFISGNTTTYYQVLNNQTNIKQLYFPNDTNFNIITKFGMATSGTRTRLIVYNDQNYNNSVFDIDKSFYFVSNGTNETNNDVNAWWTISTLSYNTGKVSDVFYYSIDKVQESPLFNWAKNSIIYTGMNNFTNSLSITTPFIPLLLTYWLIISVVYFLYDIVLVILIVLHKKIHKLEESI